VKKTLLSTLIVALLLGLMGATAARADSPDAKKPLAVVSISGYDEIKGDVNMIGELAGRANVVAQFEAILNLFTANQGLAGLDKKRPLGVVVHLDGEQPGGYAFVPVTDMGKLIAVVKPFASEMKTHDGGVYEFPTPEKPLFVQKQGNWAVICDSREALADAPKAPGKLLARLAKDYDLAVRMNVCNIPAKQRQAAIDGLKSEAEKQAPQRDGEDDQMYAVRKMVTDRALKCLTSAVNEIEQVTLGWSIDGKAKKTLLEISATALPGSSIAKALAKTPDPKTSFAGFLLPGAAVTGNCTLQCPQKINADDVGNVFDVIRTQAFKGIDAKESGEKAEAIKKIVGGLLDVTEETIATGRADGAFAVMLKPDAATILGGRFVADGPKLESALALAVKAIRKEHPEMVKKMLTTNADSYKDIDFHVLSIPIPEDADDRDKAVKLVGEKVEAVLGIGPQAVYGAVGKDALKTLKQAIKASEGTKKVAPMELTISATEIARFIASVADGPEKQAAEKALAVLEESSGNDNIRLIVEPIARGAKLRLEVEEAILRTIAKASQQK